MITNIFDHIKIVRKVKGGSWVKTKHRGWISNETYMMYLSYGFSPGSIKYEDYEGHKLYLPKFLYRFIS